MNIFAKFLFLAATAVYVQAQTVGLKDVYANKFRFGTILNSTTVGNSAMTNIVKREFNSITPENELKPDATITCSGSTNTDIKVSLSRAKTILDFCQANNIPVRGHTLVWHSQSPTCFFKDNFQDGGNWVSKAVMDQRMESYIKNMFAAIKAQYPTLNLYAYDVVNEAAKTSGSGPRDPGTGNDQSKWVQIYGDNSFIEKAFTFARQYAPPTTKLFYNDFNEYMSAKRDYIANSIIAPLKAKNLIDGMGMQSHLDVRTGGTNAWPSASEYGQAITKYKSLGVEIQVTEIDATLPEEAQSGWNNYVAQAAYYGQIMNAVLNQGGDAVTAFVVWGIQDDQSWRKTKHPLLFNASGAKKPAYDTLYNRIPQSQWGGSSSSRASSSSVAISSSSSSARSSSSVAGSSSSVASSSSFSVASSSSSSVASNSSSSGASSSSSSVANSSSSLEMQEPSSSSSIGNVSPIVSNSQAIISNSQTTAYYSLQGTRLGSAKPSKSGVYIAKNGRKVEKIVVK